MYKVQTAILNTKLGALLAILAMRNPSSNKQIGSKFHDDIGTADLLDAKWEVYTHPAIAPPAKGFRTYDIHGHVRVKPIEWVMDLYGPTCRLTLFDGHITPEKPEGSGFVECILPIGDLDEGDDKADFTTLLIGPPSFPELKVKDTMTADVLDLRPGVEWAEVILTAAGQEVVWTFFPGDPVGPSKVKNHATTGESLHKTIINAITAREMGFEYVKLAAL